MLLGRESEQQREISVDRVIDSWLSGEVRFSHTHIIGKGGFGKTCLAAHACDRDIAQGHGVAVIDPHGDFVEDVMDRITEKDVDRVVYFNSGHPELVPLWNPLAPEQGLLPDRQADNRLRDLAWITSGWGHRLETFMRHAFYGLIRTGEGTLLDVSLLLVTKSEESERIRQKILDVVENEKARHFWEHEIKMYRTEEFAPVQNRLSKLLLYDTVALMFSQPENRFNFREIMDTGKVFVANLANLGSEVRDIVGGLLLSMLGHAALSRSDISEEARRPFHIFVDEAQCFMSPAIEDMLATMRRCKCSLTLVHQFMKQIKARTQVDALGAVGTTIAFKVVAEDVPRIASFLGGRMSAEDLTTLAPREAIARIGNDVVRIKTPSLTEETDRSPGDLAKELSYQMLYKPAVDVQESIRGRLTQSSRCMSAQSSRRR
jgi:hypothetical protein